MALVVAVVLAGVALVQRNEARKQTEIAQGRELVASSAATLGSDPELSLWFAIRAAGTASSPQADALLRQAFHESRARAAYRDPGAPEHPEYRVLAVSPDLSRTLVREETTGAVYLRSLRNGDRLVRFEGVRPSLLDEASFSPDGSAIAISGGVYSVEAGRRVFPLSATAPTFTADGSRLFGIANQQVSVWDREGVLVRAIPTSDFLVAANRDGTALLSWRTCNGCSSLPTVWDVASGQQRFVLGDPSALDAGSVNPNDPQSLLGTAPTMVAAFSPDDKYIVTGDAAGVIRVWLTAAPLAAVAEFHAHTRAVTSLAFSDDGKRILSGSDDRTARVFVLASGESEYVLRGHTTAVQRAMFASGDNRVATIHADGTVRVWDSRPFRVDESTFEPHGVENLQIDDAGRRVLDSDRLGHAGVWSLDTGRQVLDLSAGIHRVPRTIGRVTADDVFVDAALSADGRRVVALDPDGDDAQVWDVASGKSVARLRGAGDMGGAPSVDADGARATTLGETGVRIWDARTGTLLRTLDTGPVERALLDHAGQRVLVVRAGEASVWDTATGTRAANLTSLGTGVQHFRFSRDGKLLAGVDEAGSVRVWDSGTGTLRRAGYVAASEQSAPTPVVFVAFGADAHQLVTIASNGDLRVWDTASGRELAEPPSATISNQVGVEAAQVSPDGERVVVVIGAFAWRYGCPLCLSTRELLTRARSHVSSYVKRHARALLEAQ